MENTTVYEMSDFRKYDNDHRVHVKNFKQFTNESSEYDTKKEDIDKDITAEEQQAKLKSSNDTVIKSMENDINNLNKRKEDINKRVEKIEKLLSDTNFDKKNGDNILKDKTALEKELEKYDKMILGVQTKIDKLQK